MLRRAVRVVVGAGVLAVLLSGCVYGSNGSVVDLAQLGVAQESPPRLTVNPPDGATGVSPAERVTAVVAGGQLTQVQLSTADGTPVAGALSPDGERWSSSQSLQADTSYLLTASSRSSAGVENTTSTRFSTLAPGQRVTGTITPDDSSPVALDESVRVEFDKPIGDRAAVERALRVTANPAARGTTEWTSNRELQWHPTPAWPPGSTVTVSLDIFGKQLGNGLVGASDLRTTFPVADQDGGAAALRSPSSRSAEGSPSSASRSAASSPSARSPRASRSPRPSASRRPSVSARPSQSRSNQSSDRASTTP